MSSRGKRASKVINYAALDGTISDDDFDDFTPPSKKKKDTKSNKKESDKENESKTLDEVKTSTQLPVRKRSPKERLSVEERKFQRDLELALELSTGAKDSKSLFQGFNGEVEKEKEEEILSFSPVRNGVTTAEVHSTLSGKKIVSEGGRIPPVAPEEEDVPMQLGWDGRRPRKKVNFVEDDSSDDFSDLDALKNVESESEESDFFPSPKAKKNKKTKPTKKTLEPKKKTVTERKPIEPKTKPVNDRKPIEPKTKPVTERKPIEPKTHPVNDRKPLKPKQINSTATSSNVDESDGSSCGELSSKSSVVSTEPVKKNLPSTPKPCYVPVSSKPGLTLVKKPFKSPSLGSPSTPSLQRPSNSTGIGLRLGLSRRVHSKPLHPKASGK